MPATSSPSRRTARHRRASVPKRTAGARRIDRHPRRHRPPASPLRLGGYLDVCGRRREVVALPGLVGSLLVVDRDAATLRDRRLVAHLCPDEPPGNATIVCRSYLACPGERRCRRLLAADLLATPPGHGGRHDLDGGLGAVPIDPAGNAHRLRRFPGERSRVELRWCRRPCGRSASGWQPVSLREVVAALECYEPARSITAAALARGCDDSQISLRQLRGEYQWLCTSPVVLNRAVREAVLRAIEDRGLSMSEIALRCGVVKRDRHGRRSGETSWLARRIGLKPEGGAKRITPWIHSDVLALIARQGLRVSPREVEVP